MVRTSLFQGEGTGSNPVGAIYNFQKGGRMKNLLFWLSALGLVVLCGCHIIKNIAPNTPEKPKGPQNGLPDSTYTFWATTTDPNGDSVMYCFDWGDGGALSWSNFAPSGDSVSMTHSYTVPGVFYIKVRAVDSKGDTSAWSDSLKFTVANRPPNVPDKPEGPSTGYVDTVYWFSTTASDPDGDSVMYKFDWGDGKTDSTGFVASGVKDSLSHSYSSVATFYIKVQAKDVNGDTSAWSDSLKFTVANRPPNVPDKPEGPSTGYVDTVYWFSTTASDPDGDSVMYKFDWGDGKTDSTGFVASGVKDSLSHSYSSVATFYIKVQAKDVNGDTSAWSDSLRIDISTSRFGLRKEEK